MANITELTENFENGSNDANLTIGNSFFGTFFGASGALTFTNDAHQGSLAMAVTASDQNASGNVGFTARSTVWACFYLKIINAPTTGPRVAIMNWLDGTTKIGDLRLSTDRRISLRDNNTLQWESSPLTANQWHRIAVKMVPGTAAGHRVKIYSGANLETMTTSQDSGNLQATNVATSQLNNIRFGILGSDTATIRIDSIQADDTAEPVIGGGGGSTLTVDLGGNQNNVNAFTTVSLSAAVSGGTPPYSYAWAQTSGSPAVSLSGSGGNRSFQAPAVMAIGGTSLGIQVTVTDSASQQTTSSATINVLCHNYYQRTAGGTWAPVWSRRRVGSNWQ